MNAFWLSLLAVAGTLVGSNMSSWWSARTARAERLARRDSEMRAQALNNQRQALEELADLVAALANHRRAMWVLGDTRLRKRWLLARGRHKKALAAAVVTTHETRAAVSKPLTKVRALLPELAEHATTATKATYALHDVRTRDQLEAQRQASVAAVAALETAAGQLWKQPLINHHSLTNHTEIGRH